MTLLDSNVVLHAVLQDPQRTLVARALLERGGSISVQTLNETTNVLRRRKLGLDVVERFVADLRALVSVLPVTEAVYDAGWRIARHYGLSTYDATIVGCAYVHGIGEVLSEDMRDGFRVFDSITVRNPFRATAA